jgi:hypothetical protein
LKTTEASVVATESGSRPGVVTGAVPEHSTAATITGVRLARRRDDTN